MPPEDIERYLIDLCFKDGFLSDDWVVVPDEWHSHPGIAYEGNAKKLQDIINWELGKTRSSYRVIVTCKDWKYVLRLVNTYFVGGLDHFEKLSKQFHK
jgi:hypothetical protein